MKDVPRLRKEIEAVDERLLKLLAERMKLATCVIRQKGEGGLPVLDAERERELEELWRSRAKELGLDSDSAVRILKEILKMDRNAQKRRGL